MEGHGRPGSPVDTRDYAGQDTVLQQTNVHSVSIGLEAYTPGSELL